MLNSDAFLLNLSLVLAHSVWYEHAAPLLAAGIPTDAFRNDMSPTPVQRDVYQEGRDSLQAQVDLAPEVLAAEQRTQPEYGKLQRQQMRDFLLGTGATDRGFLDLYQNEVAPVQTRLDREATRAQRTADIQDVGDLGADAVNAFRSANPQQKALMDAINADVLGELGAGYTLTPEESRLVAEGVGAAQASRGMGQGPADVYEQALATSEYGVKRKQQRLENAMRVGALNQATTADPFQLVTGRASGAGGMPLANMALGNNAMGPANFDPFAAGPMSILDFNANASQAANIAKANNNAAMAAAGINAFGNLGSSI